MREIAPRDDGVHNVGHVSFLAAHAGAIARRFALLVVGEKTRRVDAAPFAGALTR